MHAFFLIRLLQSKIAHLESLRSKRVRVFGWVHRLRNQKDIIFIVLRDGTGYLQTVLSGRVVRYALRWIYSSWRSYAFINI